MTNSLSDHVTQPCPCGSGDALAACCGPFLAGRPAPTATRLMRSRYTAYVLGDEDYLSRTWHSSTRPPEIDIKAGPKWIGLQVLASEQGEVTDTTGRVEFVASYLDQSRRGRLHETSRFVREGEQWFYVEGEIHSPAAEPQKTGRNEPCPCGSGKKFKRCCGV